MPSDTLIVVRGVYSMEDPWAVPPACEPVRLRRVTDGAAPRLATSVWTYFDDRFLTVLFSSSDDHEVATMYSHDQPLYEEDVVEVFLAPRKPSEYYEIEVNPLGTLFDARIESQSGTRASMVAELEWDPEDLSAAVRKFISGTERTVDTVLRVPFRALGCTTPRRGEAWRANFFRVDRHPVEGDEYSAWRPTLEDPADFHVTAAFGTLLFEG